MNSFHTMSPKASEIFVEVQLRKDRTMTGFLLANKRQIVLIAGLYHANKSLGILLHLMDLDTKQAKSVNAIAFERSKIGEQDADFVIFWQ
ncbi:ChaN family lipoprotein [Campylobacter sp. MIT 97-5078]|uniref:ChaN family lipoprotein n=1 Tax=Campylobacter sp. MIT 97-5078 TaxID=1548153 RepID=UPI0021AED8D2|nr:ChaN family lipoprotein [Campylobacter sp. MIT 97-5078]